MNVPPLQPRPLPAHDDELLDLRAIGRSVQTHKKPIIIAFAVAFLLAAIAYFLTSPRYLATASMVVERQTDELVTVEGEAPALATDSPTVDTAVQILKSPDIAGRVVDALKLTSQPEFNPELLVSGPPPQATAAQKTAARERAIRILGGSLGVKREGISYAIGVQYASESPKMAAAIPNAVIDQYLASNIEGEAGTTRRSAQLLETRLEELRAEVLAAEGEVAQYRAARGLFAVSDVSSVTQQELSGLNSQLADAKALQATANARFSAARGRSGANLDEALKSEVITALRTRRSQLTAEVSDAGSRYGPLHPDYVKTKDQLADIDRQINAEVGRVVASLASEARVAQGRTGSIAASLGGAEGRLATDVKASVRLSELERNAQSARELYQIFLDEYKKTVATLGAENSGAKAISRAAIPVMPISPNPWLYAAIALLAGCAASVVILFVINMREKDGAREFGRAGAA